MGSAAAHPPPPAPALTGQLVNTPGHGVGEEARAGSSDQHPGAQAVTEGQCSYTLCVGGASSQQHPVPKHIH